MPPEDSTYPQDWLEIAEKDLSRVQVLLDGEDSEDAGFHLQQSIEKYLKAFLLSKGWHLRRIHNLELLLNDALAYDPSLEEFRALCQKVTGYYFVERYPFTAPSGMTHEKVAQSLAEARQLIERLRDEIA